MYVLDKRNTLWLRDTVRQTSLGKGPTGRPRPLTSLGISAWPYCVTTKYLYIYIYIYQSYIYIIYIYQVFRFSWQLFICIPWQPVHSNSVICLATIKWATNCPFYNTKIHIYVNKTWKKISLWTWPSGLINDKNFGLGFCLLSPSGHVFHTAWETMIKSYNSSARFLAFHSGRPIFNVSVNL